LEGYLFKSGVSYAAGAIGGNDLEVSMSERRRHSRPSIIGKITVSTAASQSVVEGFTINISRGGIGFYMPIPLEMNTEVHLVLRFRDENEEVEEGLAGRVRWIKPLGTFYAVGVQFTELKEDRNPLTMAYIELAGKEGY
jgi:Tfp pilus assembly protein PilZ